MTSCLQSKLNHVGLFGQLSSDCGPRPRADHYWRWFYLSCNFISIFYLQFKLCVCEIEYLFQIFLKVIQRKCRIFHLIYIYIVFKEKYLSEYCFSSSAPAWTIFCNDIALHAGIQLLVGLFVWHALDNQLAGELSTLPHLLPGKVAAYVQDSIYD